VSIGGSSQTEELDDPTVWEAKNLPSKVKLEAKVPKLAVKDKEGGLPYHTWKVRARSTLATARGAEWLLDIPPPLDGASLQVREWYEGVDRIVFNPLFEAVDNERVLADEVGRLQGTWGSSYHAWRAIKKHFVREAPTNRTHLTSKLLKLAPGEKESMESFLNRCEKLREEYESYGLKLKDEDLLVQIFLKLSIQWLVSIGLSNVKYEDMSWNDVKVRLQLQDTIRRQSNLEASDALMPLGWVKRQGGAHAAGGSTDSGESSPPSTRKAKPARSTSPGASAHEAGGNYKGKGPQVPKNSWKGKDAAKEQPSGKPLICYHCLKTGHIWHKCKTKPENWEPTEEQKAKAEEIRLKRWEQSQHAKAAQASGSGTSSSARASVTTGTSNSSAATSAEPVTGESSSKGKASVTSI
jgi:hypothetical protein